MNYNQYKQAKSRFLSGNPLRLDCMNPSKALECLVPARADTRQEAEACMRVIRRQFGLPDWAALGFGLGVRDILEKIFRSEEWKGRPVLLPEDVYPVYFELLRGNPLATFVTLPELNLQQALLEAPNAEILLLPIPLVPAGRQIRPDEVKCLTDWLKGKPTRQLIIDATYSFAPPPWRLSSLLETGRCVLLGSLSKAWLGPNTLGFAATKSSLPASVQLKAEPLPIGWDLSAAQGLPETLQKLFTEEWRQTAPRLQTISPEWVAPEIGYFSTIHCPFDRLLEEHGILGVPASVFGSKDKNVTVVSCLYGLQKRLNPCLALYADAAFYDEEFRERTHDLAFFIEAAKKTEGSILELGCGTGRITLPIHEAGRRIIGIDISGSMLARAEAKSVGRHPAPVFRLADMSDFQFPEKFQLIFAATNIFQHLLTTDSVMGCLRSVREALTDNGYFILDIFNPNLEKLRRPWTQEYDFKRFQSPRHGEVLVRARSEFLGADSILHFELKYYRAETEELLKVKDVRMRCFSHAEIRSFLTAGGFEIETCFGDYTRAPFNSASPKQIFICTRS